MDDGKEVMKSNTVTSRQDSSISIWNILPKSDLDSQTTIYQKLLRSRRQFWKQFMFDPGQISVHESKGDPKALIKAKLNDYKEDIPAVEMESIQMLDKDVVLSRCDPSSGAVGILLDSVRIRQFLKTSRLALPQPKLAPVQIGIIVAQGSSENNQDIKDLLRYVQLLLLDAGLEVMTNADVETLDDLGVPFTVIINEDSLANGALLIRDRETTWFEQIHLSHVVPRMVKTFQDRNVPDTLNLVKQKYKLEQ